MKLINFTIALAVSMMSLAPSAPVQAQVVNVNFSIFQEELSPYGRWMHNPRYGNVWVYNEAGFRPYYTNGYWDYTNYGWTWVSNYDWGWAPFHYGRWEHDPFYGWMWIPGYEWASAWVTWSSYDDYYGWAPLGYGVNINVSFGAIPYNNWYFVPRRNICERNLSLYYVSPQRNNRFRNAVVINNYYNGRGAVGRYVRGPERREVERYTNNRIQERRINYSNYNRNRDQFDRNDRDRNYNRNDDRVNRGNNNRNFDRNDVRVNRGNNNRNFDRNDDRVNRGNSNRNFDRIEDRVNSGNNNRNNQGRQFEDRRNNPGTVNPDENRRNQNTIDRPDRRVDTEIRRGNRQFENNGADNDRKKSDRDFRPQNQPNRQQQMRTPEPQRQQPAFERRQFDNSPADRNVEKRQRSNGFEQRQGKRNGKRGAD